MLYLSKFEFWCHLNWVTVSITIINIDSQQSQLTCI